MKLSPQGDLGPGLSATRLRGYPATPLKGDATIGAQRPLHGQSPWSHPAQGRLGSGLNHGAHQRPLRQPSRRSHRAQGRLESGAQLPGLASPPPRDPHSRVPRLVEPSPSYQKEGTGAKQAFARTLGCAPGPFVVLPRRGTLGPPVSRLWSGPSSGNVALTASLYGIESPWVKGVALEEPMRPRERPLQNPFFSSASIM